MKMFELQNPLVDILAIGAHPDDLEHAIGGSLLHWRAAGYTIQLVHMTDGAAGTHGSPTLRREEAQAAAAMLDSPVEFLDFADTRIRDSEEARLKLIRVVRQYRPRVILAPYYNYAHMHPDHEETGRIVRGIIRLSRLKGIDTGQEPFPVRRVFYYILPHELKPTFIMDVSAQQERWKELARCYKSQIDNLEGYFDLLMSRRAMWRGHYGITWGEPFFADVPPIGNAMDLRGI